MSDIFESTIEILQKERRHRRAHAKVRTGCITCKVRRKKCDETKPECLRCTSTGRNCDGYIYPVHKNSTLPASSLPSVSEGFVFLHQYKLDVNSSISRKFNARRSQENVGSMATTTFSLRRPPSGVTFSSDIDYHCFDYYRFNTGPQFEGYFDSSIWRSTAIRNALLHPVVLKAATAVGAVHRRYNFGISREAFEYCAIADRLYREAAQEFAKFYQNRDSALSSRDIVMVCSMLFHQFESFQGNYSKAVQHMSFGLKSLWATPLLPVQSESRYLDYKMGPTIIQDFFDKVYLRASQLFGSPPRMLASVFSDEPLPPIPRYFQSLKEASDVMFTEFEWIMHTPTRLWRNPLKRRERQSMHVTRVLQWSAAYAETVRSGSERTQRQREICLLLKLLRDASHLVLYLVYFVQANNEPGLDPSTFPNSSTDNDLSLDLGLDLDIDLFLTTDEDLSSSSILTSPTLWSLIPTRRDLSTKLARLSLHADTILDPNNPYNYTDSHSLSVETGIGPPRFPHTEHCPEGSSKTRHLIKALLSSSSLSSTRRESNHGEGTLWSSLGIYGIAERLSSVEEFAVLDAVTSLTSLTNSVGVGVGAGVGDRKKIEWVDVTCFLERRRVLLKYCWDDGRGEDGRGLVWTQEWLEF